MAEYMITIASKELNALIQQAFSETLQEDPESSSNPWYIVETMNSEDALPVLGMPTYVIVDRLKSGMDLHIYLSGRVFDETGELKWQRMGETFHIVYIGRNLTKHAQTSQVKELSASEFILNDNDKTVFLWGEKVEKTRVQNELKFGQVDNIFLELQIPQYLRYPIQANDRDRVQIQVREFYNQAGQLEYFRFVNMKSIAIQHEGEL